jgi:hypothetical protein
MPRHPKHNTRQEMKVYVTNPGCVRCQYQKKRIQKEMGMTPLCQKNSLADADDAQINIPRNAWGPKFLNMVVL